MVAGMVPENRPAGPQKETNIPASDLWVSGRVYWHWIFYFFDWLSIRLRKGNVTKMPNSFIKTTSDNP